MRLNELQKHKLQQALSDSSSVLNEVRRKTLKGKRLKFMKTLEQAVVALEVANMQMK